MKFFETKQRAEGGGWPLDNGNGIVKHGDGVILIERNQFFELLDDLRTSCSQNYEHLEEITKILINAEGYRRGDGAYVVTRSIRTHGRGEIVSTPEDT